MNNKTKVLMVCLGNICRSPSAQGVFENLLKMNAKSAQFEIDSAGTAAFHVGNAPDPRSIAAARKRGVDISGQRARKVCIQDFYEFDYIFAMDTENLKNLNEILPKDARASVNLFLSFSDVDSDSSSVPDPYYSGEEGFEIVLDLLESASQSVLAKIEKNTSSLFSTSKD